MSCFNKIPYNPNSSLCCEVLLAYHLHCAPNFVMVKFFFLTLVSTKPTISALFETFSFLTSWILSLVQVSCSVRRTSFGLCRLRGSNNSLAPWIRPIVPLVNTPFLEVFPLFFFFFFTAAVSSNLLFGLVRFLESPLFFIWPQIVCPEKLSCFNCGRNSLLLLINMIIVI